MNGTVITKKGMQLLIKLLAAKGLLKFTRVSVGTGILPSGYDPASMVDLVQYKMDGIISQCKADGDVAKITMQISSIGIETGFTLTEIGIYAEDPDIGEILYSYLDIKEDPQYIYAEGGETQKFIEITLEVAIENATKVTTYMDPESLITREQLENLKIQIAQRDQPIEVMLFAAYWSKNVPYSQRVAMPGIRESDNPVVSPCTPKELEVSAVKVYRKMAAMITDGETEDGYVTFYCGEKKPTEDFKVYLRGVSANG